MAMTHVAVTITQTFHYHGFAITQTFHYHGFAMDAAVAKAINAVGNTPSAVEISAHYVDDDEACSCSCANCSGCSG